MKLFITPILIGAFLLTPFYMDAQIGVKKKQPVKLEQVDKKQPANRNLQVTTPLNRKLQTTPVALKKIPTLNPSLFRSVRALERVDISDKRDNTDKTTLEASSSSQVNHVNKTGSNPVGPDQENCYTTTNKLDITSTDFSYFTEYSVPDFIKPGVVINYQSILDGTNTINRETRDPLTIYLVNTSAIQGSGNLSVDVEHPENISAINNALGSLTGSLNTKSVPANMSIEVTEINSEKELQYAITGSYSYGSFLSAKFGVSGQNYAESYYYLIKFTQSLYTVNADPNTVIFKNAPMNAGQLAYISEVTYGRKGLLMIKTDKSMSQIRAELNVSGGSGLHKGQIEGFMESVSRDSSSSARVFFYGGSSEVAALSLQAVNMKQGFDNWVAAEAGNGLLGLPISYKVKNLKGETLKLSTVFTQKERDCVPRKDLKLKVTLLELDAWNTKDRDKIGDYGVRQHVKFTVNGKIKTPQDIEKRAFKGSSSDNCGLANNESWPGATALACGSKNDQIHVVINPKNTRRNLGNIKNSVVYHINADEVSDKNAKFEINTWVKEYSDSDILMNYDFKNRQEVPIHFILAELQGISHAPFKTEYKKVVDGSLDEKVEYFQGVYLPLMRVQVPTLNKTYIDAVLRARNSGSDLKEKAFLFLRFELID